MQVKCSNLALPEEILLQYDECIDKTLSGAVQ